MGAMRGLLLVFVAVLLFLSILSANLFWVLSLSLDYNNVEKGSSALVQDFLKEINVTSAIKQAYPLINFYCQNYSEYVFNYQGYTFDIPCSIVSQGENAIVEEGVKDLVKSVYYKDYECTLLNCPDKSQLPLLLISEKARDFWENNFYISLVISFVLLILVFLLVEKKTNVPILVGIFSIISSLLFIKLDSFFVLFSDKLVFKFLRIFFSQTYSISLNFLIAGIALVVIGIIFKIFKVGFWISEFISQIRSKSGNAAGKFKQIPRQNAEKKQSKRKSK